MDSQKNKARKADELQKKLNKAALIVKKYDLGGKDYYDSLFSNIDKSKLDSAWLFAEIQIRNYDVIQNATEITSSENVQAIIEISIYGDNKHLIYERLLSPFHVKVFKNSEEKVERKVRNYLAIRYIQITQSEVSVIIKNISRQLLLNNARNKVKYAINKFISKSINYLEVIIPFFILSSIVFLFIWGPRIYEGLKLPEVLLKEYLEEKYDDIKIEKINVEELTNYLHEKSRYGFNGAVCNDGWESSSQGRGTCSHHRGVDYYFYENDYRRTKKECREEASATLTELRKQAFERSWRD
jgi:hypothetical protein